MTRNMYHNEIFEFDFEDQKKAVKQSAKIAVKALPEWLNRIYVFIGSIALALVAFMSVGIYAATQRGFNGGLGGEVILAAAVFIGVRILWRKVKRKINGK